MKRKVIFSIFVLMLCAMMFPNVFASSNTDENSGFETLPEEKITYEDLDIKDVVLDIESHSGTLNGKNYAYLYSIANPHVRGYSYNGGATYAHYFNWMLGAPTNMSSNPFPFDKKLGSGAEASFIIALTDARSLNTSHTIAYTGGYCVGWGVDFGKYENDDAYGSTEMKEYHYSQLKRSRRDGDYLSEEGMRQVSYVLTFGYNYPMTEASEVHEQLNGSVSTLEGIHCYGANFIDQKSSMATQFLCWWGSNEFFKDEKADDRNTVQDYYFERSWSGGNGNLVRDGVEDIFIDIRDKVLQYIKMPSYSKANRNEVLNEAGAIKLEWNEVNQRFEHLTPDVYKMNLLDRATISYPDAPAGLHFEPDGNGNVMIWTTEVIGDKDHPVAVTVQKDIHNAKRATIVSKAKSEVYQPIAVPVDGEICEQTFIGVYTEAVKIRLKKSLNPITANGIRAYGDAYLKDCEYTIYKEEDCITEVAKITTANSGYTEKTTYLPYQVYYAKETSNNESTYYNDAVYRIDPTTAVKDADNDLVVTTDVSNFIVKNRLKIMKYVDNDESTEKDFARGAVLRLTLVSNPAETYTATIGDKGETMFDNIPWGVYKLSEDTSNSNYHLEIEDKIINLKTPVEQKTHYMIIEDEQFKTFLKIIKVDKITGKVILLPNAEFKIYDCEKGEFVKWFVTEERQETEILKTNAQGILITPQELRGGKYVIYEKNAPAGYYLDPKYAEPADKTQLGTGGIPVDLTKNIVVEEIEVEGYRDKCFLHTIEVEEEPLRAELEIFKEGQMLVGISEMPKEVKANDTTYSLTKPTYEYKGLEGVVFDIVAKYDIKSPDGTGLYEAAGTVHTITTGANGYAKAEKLFCGTYEIKEVYVSPEYVKETNIEDAVLTNTNQYKLYELHEKKVRNDKIPTQVQVEKIFEHPEYDIRDDKINVVVGLYANEDINAYNGNKVIDKNTLMDVLEGTIDTTEIENGRARITITSDVNLPLNKTYYAKELYVDYPYEMDTEKQVFEVRPRNANEHILQVYGITINNDVMDAAELGFIKISTSPLFNSEEPYVGGMMTENVDEIIDEVVTWVSSNSISKVLAVLNGQETATESPNVAKCKFDPKYTLSSAVYSIYYDEEKTEPLTKDGVPVTIVTDDTGYAKLENIPIGEYYVFEEIPPVLSYGEFIYNYDKQEEPVKVTLTPLDREKSVARPLIDSMVIGPKYVIKTDIFTSEAIPNCEFEIYDENEESVIRAVTDDEGKFIMNLDWFEEGKKYYYVELDAPEMYDLNPEPHEFVIKFDEQGKIIPTKVSNIRKSRELLVIKKDAETGETLPGCVFTIALVDKDGNQIYNAETGEPVYLVENAVTDENGEYYIEKAYFGTYKFTEITPPEGYELDEDLTGYTFTISEESPELIIFEVTNTGDIAVYALIGIAVVCVAGIAFVLIRRKK